MTGVDQRLTAAERSKAWRLANPERAAALAVRSRELRKLRMADYLSDERERYRRNSDVKLAKQRAARQANPEKFKARVRASYRKAPWKGTAQYVVNKARKLGALPRWADLGVMQGLYEQAYRLTQETGVPYEVDHIHPLRGKLLCGLHVIENLQIITRHENRVKHNRCPS